MVRTIDLHTWQARGVPRAELDDEVEGVRDGARTGVTVVCTSERHAWPCISRRGLGGCKQELVMRKCSERSIECVRRRGSSSVCSWETILQLTEVKGSVANYLAVHCVELASEVLWRWRVVMVGHPGVTVWGEPVVDWCFCCSSLSQLLGWHLLPTPLSR